MMILTHAIFLGGRGVWMKEDAGQVSWADEVGKQRHFLVFQAGTVSDD